MTFEESVEYLLSLGNEVSAMKLGLENIRKLLDALGNPHNNYLKVQAAGTNGKGSVCAFLDSICRSAGVRTGLYTSPHLVSMTERIRIDGADIGEADFARLATLVRDTCEKLVDAAELETVPTYFEQVTAIGLKAFANANIELAILETGLGGRLDATTAANAEIAAITRIDLDHQEYLGDTIEQIAAEKAAIIRPDSSVCVGRQSPEADAVILKRCTELGAIPRTLADAEWSAEPPTVDFTNIDGWSGRGYRLGLLGGHQIENAALAILVANTLRTQLPITDADLFKGIRDARHRGRLEWIDHGKSRVLLDGAHNTAGAEALAGYLASECPEAQIAMVYGTMKGKDYDSILRILAPFATDIILTEPKNSRSATVAEIAESDDLRRTMVEVLSVPDVADALSTAAGLAAGYTAKLPAFVLVTGSLYLVGDVLRIINKTDGNL